MCIDGKIHFKVVANNKQCIEPQMFPCLWPIFDIPVSGSHNHILLYTLAGRVSKERKVMIGRGEESLHQWNNYY